MKIADHKNHEMNGKLGTLAYYHPVKKGFTFLNELKGIDKNTVYNPRFLQRICQQTKVCPLNKKFSMELLFRGDSINIEALQLELKGNLLSDMCVPLNQQQMESSFKEINIYIKQTNDVNSKSEKITKPPCNAKTKKPKKTDHFITCENESIDSHSARNKNQNKHESHVECSSCSNAVTNSNYTKYQFAMPIKLTKPLQSNPFSGLNEFNLFESTAGLDVDPNLYSRISSNLSTFDKVVFGRHFFVRLH